MSPETASKWVVRIGITALCILVFGVVVQLVVLLFGAEVALRTKLITAVLGGGFMAYEWIKAVDEE